jgi:hypothetical protein
MLFKDKLLIKTQSPNFIYLVNLVNYMYLFSNLSIFDY